MEIKSWNDLRRPDERSLRFTPLGLSTAGIFRPEDAAKFQQLVISHCDLHSDVAEMTRRSFERLRMLHSLGVLQYETFTVAEDLAWLVLEQALRDRFLEAHQEGILAKDSKGQEISVASDNFEKVYEAFRRGKWKLVLANDDSMGFTASMADLQKWARRVGLLGGQRNKWRDSLYVKFRNRVAHPSYHLSMPPDSARTISDVAEIINQLWGHLTPGGRLYPAPLERHVFAIAWTNGAEDPSPLRISASELHLLIEGSQLPYSVETKKDSCVIIRAVPDDEEWWEFDPRYERTRFPVQLLWGPGKPEEALQWFQTVKPQPDSVSYLDRLFVLRIFEDRASLPRSPEVALGLEGDRRNGKWYVLKADFPLDAFGHVRHINEVERSRLDKAIQEPGAGLIFTNPGPCSCAVETLLSSVSWDEMANDMRLALPGIRPASPAELPPLLPITVASDVEAD